MMKFRPAALCRWLLAVLAVLVFLIIMAIGATTYISAQTTNLPHVTVENKTVHRGQTFAIEVRLDKNPGLSAMILELNYDKTAMELIGVERGDALGTSNFTTTYTETDEGYLIDPFRMLWDATKQDSSTGVLVTLIFQSKITAPTGDYPIELTYDAKNTNSEYGKPIAVDIDNGVVTLIKGEYTAIYKNWDGTVLYEKDYNENDVPSYPETYEKPKRPENSRYSYEFKGWKGEISNEPGVIIYVADYTEVPQIYQVTFIVDGKYFHGDFYDYGEIVDLSKIPSKENHSFSGWYADENFTQKVTYQQMTDRDLTLYGYMKYNVREESIPQITLSVNKIENGVAFVNVDVTRNTGLAGLVLTLDYDRTALEFIGFERGGVFTELQFDYTNTENGYDVDQFKFYWESAINTFETGTIVTLKFKIDETKPAGLYGVTVTYDETTDATFFTEALELWYTKLEIIGASVPIGNIHHWYEDTEDGIGIDVTTEEGQSPDTILEVKKVTYKISLSGESITAAAGENMELKDVYSIRLMRDGVEIEPDGRITVKIKLTEAQAKCKKIMLFHLDADGGLTLYDSRRDNGFIVFETEHLSNWALIGDIILGGGGGDTTDAPTNTPILIIAPILLAVATMGFSLLLIARLKKKKQAFVSTKNE